MKYKQWLEEWLACYVKPAAKARTYGKYLRQTQKYLIPQLGEYELDGLSVHTLQKFVINLFYVKVFPRQKTAAKVI